MRRTVKPGGVVIGNIWGKAANPLYESMVRTYQEIFDELFIIEVQGTSNRILLALPRKQLLRRVQFVDLARKLGKEKHFLFDPGNIEEGAFAYASRKSTEGRVLRDADTNSPPR